MSCTRFSWCVTEHGEPGWANAHRTAVTQAGDIAVYGILIDDSKHDPHGLVGVRLSNPTLSMEFHASTAEQVASLVARIEGEHAAQVSTALLAVATALIEAEGPQ